MNVESGSRHSDDFHCDPFGLTDGERHRLMLQAWRPILLLVTLILGMNIGGSEVSQMIILTRLPEMSSFINLATIGIPSCLNS